MSIISPSEISARYNIKLTGVIHVGAHEGEEVEEYLSLGLSKICLFEANKALKETLDVICRAHKEVSAEFYAISDRVGLANFDLTSSSQSSSLLGLKLHADIYPDISKVDRIVVETRTLDSLFSDERLEGINLLNIDVQGAELLVLRGGERVLQNIDVIIAEINYAELYEGCPTVEEIDLFLFDHGFMRVDTKTPHHPTWGDAAYVRSSFIKDLSFIHADKRFKTSMSSLGNNGRFANQMFQYLFIVMYALRSGCKPIAPAFPAASYLSACVTSQEEVKLLPLPWLETAETSFLETSHPPRNVDIWGYFQAVPQVYRTHRAFIREMLKPRLDIEEAAGAWIRNAYSRYKRIIGLHIRRGDYTEYDDNKVSRFARVPIEFYIRLLNEIYEDGDAIFISTDDESEFQYFKDFPVLNTLLERPSVIAGLHGDFYILSQCDVTAYCNSSWSLMSGLLAKEGQRALLIDFSKRAFLPFDPWSGLFFWSRFVPAGFAGMLREWQDSNIRFIEEFALTNERLTLANERLAQANDRIIRARLMSPVVERISAHHMTHAIERRIESVLSSWQRIKFRFLRIK